MPAKRLYSNAIADNEHIVSNIQKNKPTFIYIPLIQDLSNVLP